MLNLHKRSVVTHVNCVNGGLRHLGISGDKEIEDRSVVNFKEYPFKSNTTRSIYTGKKNKSVSYFLRGETKIGGGEHTSSFYDLCSPYVVVNCRKSTGKCVGNLQPQKFPEIDQLLNSSLTKCKQKQNTASFIKVVFIACSLYWIASDYIILPVTKSTFCSMWPWAGIVCFTTVRLVLNLVNCQRSAVRKVSYGTFCHRGRSFLSGGTKKF